MNWYIDHDGAAEGPYDEAQMTTLAREHRLDSQSLVWHSDLEEWSTVAALAPTWWSATLPAHMPEPTQEPKVRGPMKKIVIPATAEDVAVTPVPVSNGNGEATAPKRRLTAPKAPTITEADDKASGGVLKKLFGFGKKK